MLRKINAALGLLTAVLLIDHAAFLSIWMLSRCSIEKSGDFLPRILVALMTIHVILSIVLMIRGRKGIEKKKYKEYSKLNIETYIQRISGILVLILIALHIAGAAAHFQPVMLHAVFHPLFFCAALIHASVSVGRAMITLGIGNAKVVRIINIVMKALCSVIFVAGVIGFYICLFVGVAK